MVVKMKRLICLLLISALAAGLLAGCDLIPEKPALVILGTDIDREIYSYYYDRVQGRPKDYGLSDNPDEDKIKDTSIELCRKYLALNTSFVYHNLSLSSTEKVAVSDNVNNHWIRFRNHYEKIGVSKQTLNKVFTADAYEDAIFSAIYDKGVGNAQGEKELKDYFYTNFVAFRNVCAYFTLSDGSAVTEAKRQEIITNVNKIKELTGSEPDTFDSAATAAGYTASDTVILDRNSDDYPEGFFESVYDQEDGSVKIITYGNSIFAVLKENLEDLGEGVYASYREECLEEKYAVEWESTLSNYISLFTVDEINV